jgi:hypothetical protein
MKFKRLPPPVALQVSQAGLAVKRRVRRIASESTENKPNPNPGDHNMLSLLGQLELNP